jgi:hypothetical protein
MKQELEQIRARRELGRRLLLAGYSQSKAVPGGGIMRLPEMAKHLGVSQAELEPIWERFHQDKLIGTLGVWSPGDTTESGIIAIQFLPAAIKAAEALIEAKGSLGGQAMDYLRQLKKEVLGNPSRDADLLSVGERVSLEHERTLAVVDHLQSLGLAKEGTDRGSIRITGKGVGIAESEAETVPMDEQSSSSPLTYIQYGATGAVAIQQGNGSVTASGTVAFGSGLIREALSEIDSTREGCKLSADDEEIVDRILGDLRKQSVSDKPSAKIVKGCLQSLRTIAESIVSGVATAALCGSVGLSS